MAEKTEQRSLKTDIVLDSWWAPRSPCWDQNIAMTPKVACQMKIFLDIFILPGEWILIGVSSRVHWSSLLQTISYLDSLLCWLSEFPLSCSLRTRLLPNRSDSFESLMLLKSFLESLCPSRSCWLWLRLLGTTWPLQLNQFFSLSQCWLLLCYY